MSNRIPAVVSTSLSRLGEAVGTVIESRKRVGLCFATPEVALVNDCGRGNLSVHGPCRRQNPARCAPRKTATCGKFVVFRREGQKILKVACGKNGYNDKTQPAPFNDPCRQALQKTTRRSLYGGGRQGNREGGRRRNSRGAARSAIENTQANSKRTMKTHGQNMHANVKLKKSALWASAAFLTTLPTPGIASTPRQQPNILCIVCEDIGPYLGCYGDTVAVTPNLDRFATQARRYTRMFSSVGVSAPSRASLITGLYPTSFGANNMRTSSASPDNDARVKPYEAVPVAGVKCYTEFLRAAGYYCTNNSKTDYQFNAPITAWDQSSGKAHWKNRPEGMPFFAIFNIAVTHESQIWKRAKEPLVVNPDDITPPPYHPNNKISRRDWAVVYGNIAAMDRMVQKYIDEVREAGLLDNTIIIWYSDHGGPMPRQKRALRDSGTLAPFMIRFPDGRFAGTVDNDLRAFVDIPATILSLAGIKPPEYMHGKAFLGKYKEAARDYIYGARDRFDAKTDCQTAVRDRRFRLLHNYMPEQSEFLDISYHRNIPTLRNMMELYNEGKLEKLPSLWFTKPRPTEEFYDIEQDPHEMNNVIDDPRYAKDVARLRKKLAEMDAAYNPFAGKPESALREHLWPGGEQPRVADPVFTRAKRKLTIECPTPGASIAYQINGEGLARGHWKLYTGPLTIKNGDKVTAVCTRIGYKPTGEIAYNY
ncbi:N-sulfoglucosamine sulfohydrolase [Ereboglobus sp. PH5-10]|uniref:sulfatase family protein n=1 Tax=Ereboglobus sp. PH5-10 TaxID=2940629 RepID=UPI00240741E6|nr:sulfatase [Ereboglobus sp. PH5-10]MDF9827368.1 N-sulfoglucosamine sulfohydrolase [Ereboglobus sp. PH5-10]